MLINNLVETIPDYNTKKKIMIMSKYIIRLKFHQLKKKKNPFLLIPHRPTLWDGEEFKMGPSPLPPLSLPPLKGTWGRGREGKGELEEN